MVLKFGFEKIKPYLDDALNTVKGGISEIMKTSGNLGAPTLSANDLKEIDELVEIVESILKDVAIALIIVGSVMLVIVLLGCCGACYKIKIFLFLIDDKVKPILKATIKDSYKGLKGVNFISLAWNFAMQQFSCCGVDNSEDFNVCTSWDKTPVSAVSVALTSPLACCKTIPTTTSLNVNALSCAISPKIADSNSKTAVIIFLGCWIACKEGEGDHLAKDQDVLYVILSESMKDVINEVTVIFDRPQINPGNHYNPNDGIYIAPFSGQVMVFWTIGTNETTRTELMVEDRVVGTLMTAASSVTTNNGYSNSKTVKESSSSTVAVTDVQRGSHIFLRTASYDNHILKTVSSLLIRRTL
ncbi:TSPAN18 [Mytilus edulis]|uniref:TSPAN18 n=1 Tax=Mytilus edulis TaxID=6550 RepID=A0A8S3RC51_MYTED|nr:TSPAN18 [Mytilus edulis]